MRIFKLNGPSIFQGSVFRVQKETPPHSTVGELIDLPLKSRGMRGKTYMDVKDLAALDKLNPEPCIFKQNRGFTRRE